MCSNGGKISIGFKRFVIWENTFWQKKILKKNNKNVHPFEEWTKKCDINNIIHNTYIIYYTFIISFDLTLGYFVWICERKEQYSIQGGRFIQRNWESIRKAATTTTTVHKRKGLTTLVPDTFNRFKEKNGKNRFIIYVCHLALYFFVDFISRLQFTSKKHLSITQNW